MRNDKTSPPAGFVVCGGSTRPYIHHGMSRFWKKDDLTDIECISLRMRMVDEQLARRGIRDARVLAAMRTVPRHLFVPDAYRRAAYDDSPQPIGHQQTISQPYVVASMTEHLELESGDRVLEIGTGCGYQTAVLAEIVRQVYSIEIIPDLLQRAVLMLDKLGYNNIATMRGDGSLGWPDKAPFDAVIVTAAAPGEPEELFDQLALGGCMVCPVESGKSDCQYLVKYRKTSSGIEKESLYEVRFVPLQMKRKD